MSPLHKARTMSQDRSGASAVEFALVSPLLIVFMMGIAAYGIYFGAAHSVQQLSADAARVALAGLNSDERRSLVAAYLSGNSGNYIFLDGGALTAHVTDNPDDATQTSVSVSYDAHRLPIWNLYPPLPLPGQQITRVSTIRVGGL